MNGNEIFIKTYNVVEIFYRCVGFFSITQSTTIILKLLKTLLPEQNHSEGAIHMGRPELIAEELDAS